MAEVNLDRVSLLCVDRNSTSDRGEELGRTVSERPVQAGTLAIGQAGTGMRVEGQIGSRLRQGELDQ